MNVRTIGPSESRRRGGSRPGLKKFLATDLGASITALVPITYIDQSGVRQHDLVYVVDGTVGYVRAGVATTPVANLAGPDGVGIVTDDGSTLIVYATTVSTGALQGVARNGKVYFADTVLRSYDPDNGVVEDILATAGTVPTAETVICLYRDRIFLGGKNNVWHASRVGDPGDWNNGAAMERPARAAKGQLSDAGRIGDLITALVPIHDQVLVMATESSLWVMRGGPNTGTVSNVSDEIGIIAPSAWAISPEGLLVFLSHDGIYVWSAGSNSVPARFSAERVPDELREVDASTNTISMAYDPVEGGFHLFITPASGDGTHWWIDVEDRALWPQRFAREHQPLSAALLTEGGLGDVVIGSQDGYIRYFLDSQVDDDDVKIESHILIGPVRIAADDVRDALLAEIHGVMEDISNDGTVTWRVVMGRSASEVAQAAKVDLDLVLAGDAPVSVARTGIWTEGRGKVQRPRARGAWVVVWLSSTDRWSYEVVSIVARQLGRLR